MVLLPLLDARPSSLLPPLVCPGCGNPIANLAHVIRRPVRLLSALPSFFSLRTLIETGTPRPRVPLLPSPGPGYAQPIPLPNCLPPRGQPDAPSYHQPHSCVCPELTASVGCGRRDCGSIGEENGQTVASLIFLFDPLSQTAVCPTCVPRCRGRSWLTSRDIGLFRPRDVTTGGLGGERDYQAPALDETGQI